MGGGTATLLNLFKIISNLKQKHVVFEKKAKYNLPKFSLVIKVLESLIDSAYFDERVSTLGQLLTEISWMG